MTELIPIQDLDPESVRAALRETLWQREPVQYLSEFLLAVDWSTSGGSIPEDVAALLDEAEQMSIAAEEGDISLDVFLASVSDLASSVLNV